jgi:hypothetical protein
MSRVENTSTNTFAISLLHFPHSTVPRHFRTDELNNQREVGAAVHGGVPVRGGMTVHSEVEVPLYVRCSCLRTDELNNEPEVGVAAHGGAGAVEPRKEQRLSIDP